MKQTITILVACLLVGCSNAQQAAWNAQGKPHHVQLFSGGKMIGEWDTTGKVENEGQSDGYFFQDAATQRMVCVCGQVIITVK